MTRFFSEYPSDSARVQEIRLDRLKVAAGQYVTGHALDRLEIQHHEEFLTDRLLVQLRTEILGHPFRVQWQLTEERPDGWFQYLKRRHAPRWILKRWPVRHKLHQRTLTLPVTALFPEAPAVPAGPVRFAVTDLDPVRISEEE